MPVFKPKARMISFRLFQHPPEAAHRERHPGCGFARLAFAAGRRHTRIAPDCRLRLAPATVRRAIESMEGK